MEVTWSPKARRPDIQGPGVEKVWGLGAWRKETKWGKETHSCGTQRGSPWRSSRPERKEVEKGTASEPCIQEGQYPAVTPVTAPEGEGSGNEQKKD